MTAVGCPHYDPHGKQYFGGKFSICPFFEMVVANIVARIG